jgi:carboxyl-terminal processing protease
MQKEEITRYSQSLEKEMHMMVYGGGGIIPDVFVPVDTTRASAFFVACNKKATQMRFASEMFDRYHDKLSPVESFDDLIPLLDGMDLPKRFRAFAQTRDGITATDQEWEETLPYLEPQLRALVGRYSRLGENAFYKLYEEIDSMLQAAIRQGT